MSTRKKSLDVTIMGRDYKVACSDEEREGLLEAVNIDRKSTRLNSSHVKRSRMPSSA